MKTSRNICNWLPELMKQTKQVDQIQTVLSLRRIFTLCVFFLALTAIEDKHRLLSPYSREQELLERLKIYR